MTTAVPRARKALDTMSEAEDRAITKAERVGWQTRINDTLRAAESGGTRQRVRLVGNSVDAAPMRPGRLVPPVALTGFVPDVATNMHGIYIQRPWKSTGTSRRTPN